MNEKDFNAEIEKAFQTAWHSEKGGDENWNRFMAGYGIAPLSAENKALLFDSDMKIAKGAFPIELRRVYESIIVKYSSAGLNIPFDMESRIKDYYQKIKPFGGMNDIFKNAASGSLGKYSAGMKKAKHHTMTCKSCGAPRLEEMQYDNCMFCGSKLFEPIKQ
jgi:hypothetical protein